MRLAPPLTIGSTVTVEGVGLHTGEKCGIRISPADERCGIIFLVGADRTPIQANADNVGYWKRQTALVGEKASVGMVEHLLAALAGLGILHAIVDVTGPEIPALDGSALPFVELIDQAGMRALGDPVPRTTIPSPIVMENGESRLAAHPDDKYMLTVTVRYPDVGEQTLSLGLTPAAFKKELAPARTFGFAEEAKEILASGLAAGASLENVVLVDRGEYSSPLRFPDELVRHKMLDLVGDLALVGMPFDARIEALRPGHRVNVMLARRIASALASEAGRDSQRE